MTIIRLDITSYFSPLSMYYGYKYVSSDVSDFRSNLDAYASPAYSMCRQDSGQEESIDTCSFFSSSVIVGVTPV